MAVTMVDNSHRVPHASTPPLLENSNPESEGGGLFESPPSPLRHPKVFEPIFLQIKISGESVGTEGSEKKNLVENSQMGEKHTKKLDPLPHLRVGPWLMGA